MTLIFFQVTEDKLPIVSQHFNWIIQQFGLRVVDDRSSSALILKRDITREEANDIIDNAQSLGIKEDGMILLCDQNIDFKGMHFGCIVPCFD